MSEDSSTEWTVSEDELNRLTQLFREFEGAADPRSVQAREAEAEFNSLTDHLYLEKVALKFKSITLPQFRSYARHQCRVRLAKEGPPFPSV